MISLYKNRIWLRHLYRLKAILHAIVFVIVLMSVSSESYAGVKLPEHIELSDSSYISLLTCDPGNQLYAAFGHSAVGVVDYKKQLNIVFNYGTFSFNTPNFYVKFASGKLNYRLSVTSLKRFIREYEQEGRMVVEQKLNLTQEQKQVYFNALLENYKPENRAYMYDFFFDNCATRIVDLLETSMGDSLTYHPQDTSIKPTFRNLIDQYLVKGSWSDLGIDLALGSVIDVEASSKEQAFLPHYLGSYFDNCTIGSKPLVAEVNILIPDNAKLTKTPFLISPWFVFWFAFVLVLFFTFWFYNKPWIIADRIIFSTMGILGVVVLLLWFATDHDATVGNINFIWANPFYLVFAWLLNGKSSKFIQWASLFFLLLSAVVLLGWNSLPQQFNPIFIPIIGIAVIRLMVLFMRSFKA